MPRFDPYSLRMQISRMFEQGQSFFCTLKVQDWLRERHENPDDYEIIFHHKPPLPGAGTQVNIEIELRRKDGQPVSPELQEDVNYFA